MSTWTLQVLDTLWLGVRLASSPNKTNRTILNVVEYHPAVELFPLWRKSRSGWRARNFVVLRVRDSSQWFDSSAIQECCLPILIYVFKRIVMWYDRSLLIGLPSDPPRWFRLCLSGLDDEISSLYDTNIAIVSSSISGIVECDIRIFDQ